MRRNVSSCGSAPATHADRRRPSTAARHSGVPGAAAHPSTGPREHRRQSRLSVTANASLLAAAGKASAAASNTGRAPCTSPACNRRRAYVSATLRITSIAKMTPSEREHARARGGRGDASETARRLRSNVAVVAHHLFRRRLGTQILVLVLVLVVAVSERGLEEELEEAGYKS